VKGGESVKLAVWHGILIPIVVSLILMQYPYVHNPVVTQMYMADRNILVIKGTLEIDFTHPEIYHKGNFYWFNDWWQQQVGKTYGPYRLVAITWTLLEEGETSDKLGFELRLKFEKTKIKIPLCIHFISLGGL
jgi:hypothetical protein